MINSCKKTVSTHVLIPVISESLNLGMRVRFTVSGGSMLPWLAGNRDQVVLCKSQSRQLRRGDIILYKSEQGSYKLHRIYKTVEAGYYTIGDACLLDDGLVREADILGVVDAIIRKGKEISYDTRIWRVFSFLWLFLIPIRKYLLTIYFLLAGMKRKASRLISYCKMRVFT